MGLTKAAILRPVFIFMLMAAAIMMGMVAYKSMRVELNPDVSFGVVTVTTVYPGAGPDEINSLISKKIEDAVTGIANVREVTSTSQEGVSSVVVNFEIGSDINVGSNDVRSKVDAIVGELPDGAERPIIDKLDTGSEPVLTLAVKSEGLSNRQLRDLSENVLKDKFARVKGVAAVFVSGGDVREIQVRLKRDALLSSGLGIADVQNAVNRAALNIPAGRLKSGQEEFTVRVKGEFETVEEISDMYLTISDQAQRGVNKKIRLGDIADVRDSNVERRRFSRVDGLESVVIIIQKAKAGNAVEISKAIARPNDLYKLPAPTPANPQNMKTVSYLDQLGAQYGVDFVVTQDTSKTIEESLLDLNIAIFFGIFLVGLVIWTFLHNLRGTLIVSIAIPVCLFATLIALWMFGFTINNMSMLALSLAIGVLVDDSIVVIENIYRHLTMGEDPVEAAINGRAEIGLAALAITAADVVVFLPIGFMGGIVGQFFRPLGIGYAIAVLFSLFVSFTVTPMLASRWYRKGEDWEHPKGRFAQWFEGSFHRFANGYRKVLRASLNHKWYFFGGGFGILFALFMFIGGSFAPDIPGAIKTGMNLVPQIVILGVLIFVGNWIVTRKPKFSIFLGMAAFCGLMIAAPVVGNMYRQWKGEDVFKFSFAPPSDGGIVNINVEMPPGASVESTEEVVKRLEKIVMAHPEADYVVSDVGRQSGGFGASSQGVQFAQITVTLREKDALLDKMMFWKKHDKELRPLDVTAQDVASELTEQIDRVPGAKITVTAAGGFGFGAAIQLAFKSDDRELLQQTAIKVRDALASGAIEGVITPEITSKPGKPELVAIPDRARMAASNVTVQELGGAMRTLYEGDNNAKFRVNGQEYDIRVMMDLQDRNNPEILGSVPITFREGNPIYLSEVAHIERGVGVDKIERRDREEVIQVNAGLLPGFAAGSVQAKIDAWLKEEKMIPEGVSIRALGEADAQARESVYLMGALGLGLILVYMILASLFNNLIYPMIIQLAQPQAMIGALLALVITDKTFNIVGFIGVIALVGLVGKNAILLVDYANTLRERGMERFEAIVESGGTRLRPIMMTTFALLAGMLPVALAIGRGSEFRETIGITIIGGTLLSTVLTLLVIPCSYLLFDEFSTRLGKLMNRISGKQRQVPAEPTDLHGMDIGELPENK
ncbi:MAG: efflux RND transporter permease subunit [Fimbriimonadaceae bacterium]|nr:MAG: efflux RND transporter permease subunit [Fimbriimonadaceae bacterium]